MLVHHHPLSPDNNMPSSRAPDLGFRSNLSDCISVNHGLLTNCPVLAAFGVVVSVTFVNSLMYLPPLFLVMVNLILTVGDHLDQYCLLILKIEIQGTHKRRLVTLQTRTTQVEQRYDSGFMLSISGRLRELQSTRCHNIRRLECYNNGAKTMDATSFPCPCCSSQAPLCDIIPANCTFFRNTCPCL